MSPELRKWINVSLLSIAVIDEFTLIPELENKLGADELLDWP